MLDAIAASDVDPRDLHFQVRLAVANLFVIALAALVLLDVDLRAARFADDVGGDGRAVDHGRANARAAFAGDQKYLLEGDVLHVVFDAAVDADAISAGDFELF